MYIAHTVPGRYPLYPKSLVLYLEEEEGPSMAWDCPSLCVAIPLQSCRKSSDLSDRRTKID
jgi:hypothetical protein